MKVARKIEFEAILISNKSMSFQVPLLTVWVWCPFYVWFLGLFEQEPLCGLGLGVIQKRFHLKIKISKGFSVLLIHGIYVISHLLGYPMPCHPFLPLEVTSFIDGPLGPCQPLVGLLKFKARAKIHLLCYISIHIEKLKKSANFFWAD